MEEIVILPLIELNTNHSCKMVNLRSIEFNWVVDWVCRITIKNRLQFSERNVGKLK
ncbi:hypothetical protein ARNL5_00519 [Anaerolineae bacterium]|nr:hypothetical protein ARNL5_00519 [Anaerolineae bacterium]